MPTLEEEVSTIPQTTQDYTQHKLFLYTAVLHCQAKKAVEVGTDVGDSGRIIATALRKTGGVLMSIDIKDVDKGWAKDYPNIQFGIGASRHFQIKQPIDFLYLDGDHTYETISVELKNLGTWVRKGGYIVLHDTMHTEFGPNITRAIREWCILTGLRWMEDPQQHGMALIEVTREFPH